jgi:hypothetical protein
LYGHHAVAFAPVVVGRNHSDYLPLAFQPSPPRSVPCAHFPCTPASQPLFLPLASPSHSPKAEEAELVEQAVLVAEQQGEVPLVLLGVPARRVVPRGLALLLPQPPRPAREQRLPPLPAERREPAPRRLPRREGLQEVPFPVVRDLPLSARLGSRPARHPITCRARERPRAFPAPQCRRARPAVRQPCPRARLPEEMQRRPALRAAGEAQEAQPIGPWGAWMWGERRRS